MRLRPPLAVLFALLVGRPLARGDFVARDAHDHLIATARFSAFRYQRVTVGL